MQAGPEGHTVAGVIEAANQLGLSGDSPWALNKGKKSHISQLVNDRAGFGWAAHIGKSRYAHVAFPGVEHKPHSAQLARSASGVAGAAGAADSGAAPAAAPVAVAAVSAPDAATAFSAVAAAMPSTSAASLAPAPTAAVQGFTQGLVPAVAQAVPAPAAPVLCYAMAPGAGAARMAFANAPNTSAAPWKPALPADAG